LNKQRLNVKKIQNKFLNLIKLLFPWKYRFAFHSVPSTEMSSSEYRNVWYVQYRDVQVPSCPDTINLMWLDRSLLWLVLLLTITLTFYCWSKIFKQGCMDPDLVKMVTVMVFNSTFNNISVILWRSVSLVGETRVPRENHRPTASNWQTLSHTVG
jgi:hypothetical protein